jgi:hypothetical protein
MSRGPAPSALAALLLAACAGAGPDAPSPARPAARASVQPSVPRPSPPPAPASASPSRAPPLARPPVRLAVGRRVLEITFDAHASGRVATVQEGERTFVPTSCSSPGEGLCGAAHRVLRGEGSRPSKGALADRREHESFGKGADVLLVATHEGADVALALFASTTWGSPECGAYAYWVARLDARGARVGEPLLGCFGTVGEASSAEGPPFVMFTRPVLLAPDAPALSRTFTIHALDEVTLRFSPRLTVAAR